MSSPKNICVFTAGRSDYFLLRPLLDELARTSVKLHVLASGMHTGGGFGYSGGLVAKGDNIHFVPMDMGSGSRVDTIKAMGEGMKEFASLLSKMAPDGVVVLGDRFEVMAFATSAYILGIPIAHIHGGELTYGAFDDGLRHAITKMATLHFAAAEPYKDRILQMGEPPTQVFNVGALGMDVMQSHKARSFKSVESALPFQLSQPYFLVTLHPETRGEEDVEFQFNQLSQALAAFPDHQVVWTAANADPKGQIINTRLQSMKSRWHVVENLGEFYPDVMRHAAVVIGNSSSGVIEAPMLSVPSINIGSRQEGRIRIASIIDCHFDVAAIKNAITKALSPSFHEKIRSMHSPFGDGATAKKIVEILLKPGLLAAAPKPFYDRK